MPYVTSDYYNNTLRWESVDDTDFSSLYERAVEIIEEMTMYRLNEESFINMPPDIQERIKRAVCAQIEYLDANGGSDLDNGSNLQSASLGKFNYSKTTGSDESSKQSVYSPRAQRILYPTGLLYRGGRL